MKIPPQTVSNICTKLIPSKFCTNPRETLKYVIENTALLSGDKPVTCWGVRKMARELLESRKNLSPGRVYWLEEICKWNLRKIIKNSNEIFGKNGKLTKYGEIKLKSLIALGKMLKKY